MSVRMEKESVVLQSLFQFGHTLAFGLEEKCSCCIAQSNMTPTVRGEDDEPFSLQFVTLLILEEHDPMELGIFEASRFALQILFSSNISEFDELLKAIVTFDAEWARTHRKYEPLGLNVFDGVAEMFYDEHRNLTAPKNVAVGQHETVTWGLESYRSVNSPERYASWFTKHYAHIIFDHDDLHQWRSSDDPVAIGHCFHNLMSEPVAGSPPSLANAQEALSAARKLYEQPQPDIRKRDSAGAIIHNHYISRDMAIKVAIYVGDLQAALDILRLTLEFDAFWHRHAKLIVFLRIPGIYKVLSLLATEGLEANPYYIDPDTAKAIVAGLKGAMESRIANGQSAPLEKASWKDLLNRLAKAAWKVNEKDYKRQRLSNFKDVLFSPATKEGIEEAEKVVGKLPNDFKDMVRISNG